MEIEDVVLSINVYMKFYVAGALIIVMAII